MTLFSLLADDRETLAAQLADQPPADAAAHLREYCLSLVRRYADPSGTTELQDRIGALALDVVAASVGTLGAARGEAPPAGAPERHPQEWAPIAGSGVALGCALALALGAPTGVGIAGLLLAAAGNAANWPRTSAPALPGARETVNVSLALDRLGEALLAADQLLNVVGRLEHAAPPPEPLSPELLRVLQSLLGAGLTPNAEKALANIEALGDILAEQGIDVVKYDGTNGMLFESRAVLDDPEAEPVTGTPALVRGDSVLARGRVLLPAPTSSGR